MQTSIILPDRLYARLTDSAKYHGLGQSEIIRQALHRYLIELEQQIDRKQPEFINEKQPDFLPLA